MALLAVPVYEVVRVEDSRSSRLRTRPRCGTGSGISGRSARSSAASAFLALTFLVGRVAEGLVTRAGAPVAVTFGLGTMAGSLGPTFFGHLQDALCLFGAFVIGSRARRPRDWAVGRPPGGSRVSCSSIRRASRRSSLLVYAAIRGGRRAVRLGARRRDTAGDRPRRLRLAGLRRSVAALLPLHVEHLHRRPDAGLLRHRPADPARDLGR